MTPDDIQEEEKRQVLRNLYDRWDSVLPLLT